MLALVLAEDATALPTRVTAALAVAVAIVALLGRRGLPAGIGEGMFISAVSGVAILLLAIDSAGDFSRVALGHVLTGLAVLWYAASRLAARSAVSVRPASVAGAGSGDVALVWAYAALVCGLAAVANLASMPNGLASGGWSAGATDLAVLLVLSGLIWAFRTGAWAPFPTIALFVFLLVMIVPAHAWRAQAWTWGLGLNAAALLCLAVVIGAILRDWQRQRRHWLDEPESERAEDAPAVGSLSSAGVVGTCVLIGLAGVVFRECWFTPPALWLAAVACLVVGHVLGCLVAGEIGLVLVAEGLVSASMAWVTPGWPGALFGLGLAGGYLLWLARFWDQQLLDGSAWTTAGRLIPASRRLAYMASSLAFAAAMGGMMAGAFAGQNVWLAAITTLLLLGLMSLLVRDGLEHGQPGAVAAAVLMTLAAVGPASGLFFRATGEPLMLGVGVAGAGLLLALRVLLGVAGSRHTTVAGRDSTAGTGPGRYGSAGMGPGRYGSAGTGPGRYGSAGTGPGRYGAGGPIFGAFVCGVLPVVVLLVLSRRGFALPSVAGLVLTLAAVVVGLSVLRGAARAGRGGASDRV